MTCGAIYGANAEMFVTLETTFDTFVAVAAGDAVGFIESEINPTQEWVESEEHVGTASLQTEIESVRGGTWSMKCYLKSEAAGTVPETNILFGVGFNGTVTSGGSEVIYPFDSDAAPQSLQLVRYIGDQFCEWANGACIEQIMFEQEPGQPPTVTFSGSFTSYGFLKGNAQVDATTYTGAETTVSLAAADAYKIRQGARVAFGSDTGTSGAGYLVTAVSADGLDLTISPAVVTGFAGGSTVTPIVPTGTYSGTIQTGIASGFSIDAGTTELGFISGSVTVETGFHLLSGEASSAEASCVSPGKRLVSAEFSFYFKDENAQMDGKGWTGQGHDVLFRMGSSAGVNFKLDMPNMRFNPMVMTVPQFEEATYTISGKARQSAAPDDECRLVLSAG